MPGISEPVDRVSVLEAVTDVALRHMKLDEFLRAVLVRIQQLFEVDTASVLLYDSAAEVLTVEASVGMDEVGHGVTVPLGVGFTGRVGATRSPVVLDRVDHTTVMSPLLWRRGLRALLGVPMLAGDDLVGVLHVGSLTPRRFTEEDTRLLHLVADRVALTIQAEVSGAERAAATALQRSLLPTRFPAIDGLRFAARYIPGTGMTVGGDWYDVFTLPGDRLGVVIGDVAGHGLAAAVVMGRLRSALRAYALIYGSPAEVLTNLHAKVSHFEQRSMATVAYGVIDLATSRLTLSLAGHLPPALALPGQAATLLTAPPDIPIGLGLTPPWPRRETVIDLPPGSVLALYTDGLVERPGHLLDPYLRQFLDAITHDDPNTICTQVTETLLGAAPARDDVALLVVRLTPGDGLATT
ncbi:PP2C family protein-serine/threonine phosphatase [Actinokineospora cianjurensis]|uniref:PP2C family protein-serine/threonine phosphatase n=1 Tax=Actinokineospora cianjurensis TaxID=585224 RepID=UPI001FE8CBB6|nr:GAF domain-containing SpoIIE family protein phosphatase [Actinokineospora cianjurensis]